MPAFSAEISEITAAPQKQLDPSHIMQVGMGFFASKTLLSAVEFEVFTCLGGDALSGDELGGRLELHERGIDPARLEQFMRAMAGISAGNFHMLAETFDFSRYATVCDVGGATGQLSRIVAARHPDLRCTSYDKPPVHLIRSAYDALPEGGALIVIENLIDDARRENAFGLMMSLNMLIEFGDAFDYTGADFAGWCKEAGFRTVEVVPLTGPASAGIAYK